MISTTTGAYPTHKKVALKERVAAVRKEVKVLRGRSWEEWSREERALFVRQELVAVAQEVHQITQRLAPWWGWTIPPRTIRSQLNTLFDALHDWTLTGRVEDWIDARQARTALARACRAAGNGARVEGKDRWGRCLS